MKISVDDIKVSKRLRQLDNSKVDDLVTSIREIGLLQPIVVDDDNNLLCGWHRLEAYKIIGYKSIECKRVNLSEKKSRLLVELSENLVRSDLSVIEKAEHIILKESILEELGIRATQKDNQYAGVNFDTSTTKELADEIGISKRQYQRIKQISKINDTAKQILNDTDYNNNLHALTAIQQLEDDDLQIEVASKIKDGYSGSLSILIGNLIREKHDDFFPTHPSITEALLNREKLSGTILEPACGAGDMSRVLLDYGYNDVCSTDLVDRGYGTSEIDFLNDKQFSKLSYDCLVTNPPFKLGLEFVLKAKEIARKKICILNSTTFLNGIERYEKLWMDREFPLKKVYQFAGRCSFRKKGHILPTGGYMSFCWYVFQRDYKGKAEIEWILPEPNKIEW